MPNDVALFNRDLPAHLRAAPDDALNAVAAAGIAAGNVPARISYRGGRFHLVDKDGNETDPIIINDKGQAMLENNGVIMDLVIVGALPFISKVYYDQKYDPSVEAPPPACFSDNGTAPSERAVKPQSRTCAECPNNVWGSAVNPTTGKARQACNNTKKLAVVRYHDENNTVYSLGLPGASLKAYEGAVKAVAQHGAKVGGLIWRVGFDSKEAFPKLTFNAVGFLDEESMKDFEEIQQTDEVRLAIGADDKPATPQQIAARSAQPAIADASLRNTDPKPGGFVVRPRPGETAGPVMAATPASPGPVHVPVPQGLPEHTRQAMAVPPAQMQQPTPAAPAAEAPAKRKRGRPAKDPTAGNLPHVPGVAPIEGQPYTPEAQTDPAWDRATDVMPPLPAGMQRTGASVLPAATPEMDDALSRAMGMDV